MAKMPDEQWSMIEDCIIRKNIARSAHNRRTHCGKSGVVKLPSDFMTKKELKAMNSEVKSYRINDPMSWKEFKELPDDLKVLYIEFIRKEFNAPNAAIAKAMGISNSYFSEYSKSLGLSAGTGNCKSHGKWGKTEDCKRFNEWWYGKETKECDIISTDNSKNIDIRYDAASTDTYTITTNTPVYTNSCEDISHFALNFIPITGTLSFDCAADEAVDAVKYILGSQKVNITISWSPEIV